MPFRQRPSTGHPESSMYFCGSAFGIAKASCALVPIFPPQTPSLFPAFPRHLKGPFLKDIDLQKRGEDAALI